MLQQVLEEWELSLKPYIGWYNVIKKQKLITFSVGKCDEFFVNKILKFSDKK